MPRVRLAWLVYLLLVGVPALAVAWVLSAGAPSAAVDPVARAAPRTAPLDLGLLLTQLAVIAAAAALTGRLLERLGQPAVIGEMLAGIVLGPSCLGALAPAASAWLFPAASLPHVATVSQLGVLLLVFLVGTELDWAALRARAGTAVLASHASIAVPFTLGVLLAGALHGRYAPAGVGLAPFALFLGAAMSVTAFPVLVRILQARGLTRTPLGELAVACAAVDDASAWCLLAGVVALVRADGAARLVGTVVGGVLLVLVVWGVVRPWLARRLAQAGEAAGAATLLPVLLVLLGCAAAAEWIGVHALFGAFLAGAAVPRTRGVAARMTAQVGPLLPVLLLPAFFAVTGLRTDLAALVRSAEWATTALVVAVAVAGKLGGTAIGARAGGLPWGEATRLGVLMNTRGLMELVILGIGLELGVLSPSLYAMMVVMALVTTMMTAPVLGWLGRASRLPAVSPAAG